MSVHGQGMYCVGCAAQRKKAIDSSRYGHAQIKPCPRCSSPTDIHGSKCEPCRVLYVKEARRRKKQLERANRRGITTEHYTLAEIGDRDGWTCGICGARIKRANHQSLHHSPSIDHILPISQGGQDVRANVQIAHFICNTRKGNRAANDQLMLVG